MSARHNPFVSRDAFNGPEVLPHAVVLDTYDTMSGAHRGMVDFEYIGKTFGETERKQGRIHGMDAAESESHGNMRNA